MDPSRKAIEVLADFLLEEIATAVEQMCEVEDSKAST